MVHVRGQARCVGIERADRDSSSGTPATSHGWPADRRNGAAPQVFPPRAAASGRQCGSVRQWRGARASRWPAEQRAGVQGSERMIAPRAGASLARAAAVRGRERRGGFVRDEHEWLTGTWGSGSTGRPGMVVVSWRGATTECEVARGQMGAPGSGRVAADAASAVRDWDG